VIAVDWVVGDMLGLGIPAHSGSLRAGGTVFLTEAFRAAGALEADNRVTRITRFEECPGGSTGRKLLLSVEYETPSPRLHTDLFVKFSRDFDDEIRDRAKIQMELEVRFALLSRSPEFPIAVPACYFSDYHHESGTGILITQRVDFGCGGIERHYGKCLDYALPEPLEHYKALIKALARLAGTHKAGRLPGIVEQYFPFDPGKLSVSKRTPYTPQKIRNRVARYAEFSANYPGILPLNIRSTDFIARLADEAPRFMELEPFAREVLRSRPEFVALCHWNANIDNAWFWRNAAGEIECGLMDWGHVSQMNVAMALWGCMSAAETELWNNHLDELLALFVAEFRSCGGPALDVAELKLHLALYAATMGLAWLLDAPPLILAQIPDLSDVKNRFDPRFLADEHARTQLQIMTVFLNLWDTQNFGQVLARLEQRSQGHTCQ
jgi:hypothetical protein